MKKLAFITLLMNFMYLGSMEKTEFQFRHGTSDGIYDCNGVKKTIAAPKDYGVVIGNETGTILNITESDGVFEVLYQMSSKTNTVYVSCQEMEMAKTEEEVLSLKFNSDGSAHGKNKKNEDVFILLGDKSTDGAVIARTRNKGQDFNSLAMSMVARNKLPGHDAPTWYYYEKPNFVQISFVFPVGFVHPTYGPQPHVRVFIFKEVNGTWKGIEDNSSVGYY